MDNRNGAGRASQRYAQANPPSHTSASSLLDPDAFGAAESRRRRGLAPAERQVFESNPTSWLLKRVKETNDEYGAGLTPEEKGVIEGIFRQIITDGMVSDKD